MMDSSSESEADQFEERKETEVMEEHVILHRRNLQEIKSNDLIRKRFKTDNKDNTNHNLHSIGWPLKKIVNNSPILKTVRNPVPEPGPCPSPSLQESRKLPPEVEQDTHQMILGILKHVPTRDLFKCRLVSRQFKELATKILIKRPNNRLGFIFDQDSKTYINHQYHPSTSSKSKATQTLAQFNKCFKKSLKLGPNIFPFSSFYFEIENYNIDSTAATTTTNSIPRGANSQIISKQNKATAKVLLEFFKLYSKSVICLKIASFFTMTDKEQNENLTFLNHILSECSNLQHLDISLWPTNLTTVPLFHVNDKMKAHSVPSKSHQNERNNNNTSINLKLGSLTSLVVGKSSWTSRKIIQEILQAAPNLQRCQTFHRQIEDLSVFVKSNKAHTIKEAVFSPNAFNIQLILNLIKHENCQFELTVLEFDLSSIFEDQSLWSVTAKVLSKILYSSKDSLRAISVFSPLGFLNSFGLEIPTMTNLETIRITNYNQKIVSPVFPPGSLPLSASMSMSTSMTFSMAELFPKLHTVILDLNVGNDNELWDLFFPHLDIIPSVENLEITPFCSVTCIDELSIMFPHLTSLIISFPIKDFLTLSVAIWENCRLLKYLDVTIDGYSKKNHFPALDSGFTGFSEDTCNILYTLAEEQLVELVNSDVMNNVRIKPSLLYLTELESLRIHLYVDGIAAEDKEIFYLSKVSHLFAFSHLKKGSVKIYPLEEQQYFLS